MKYFVVSIKNNLRNVTHMSQIGIVDCPKNKFNETLRKTLKIVLFENWNPAYIVGARSSYTTVKSKISTAHDCLLIRSDGKSISIIEYIKKESIVSSPIELTIFHT